MNPLDALSAVSRLLGAGVDFKTLFPVFTLILARVAMAMSLMPFLGGGLVPAQARLGLATFVSLLLYPAITRAAPPEPLTSGLWVALLIKEVLIGAIIGLLAQLAFSAIQMAGELVEFSMGLRQEAILAPQFNARVSHLAQLQLQAAIVIFLAADGHLFFLSSLAGSFGDLGVTSFPALRADRLETALEVVRLTGGAIRIAVELAAPAAATLLLADVSFGMIQRIASQVRIWDESLPLKALGGMAILFLSTGFLMRHAFSAYQQTFPSIQELLQRMR